MGRLARWGVPGRRALRISGREGRRPPPALHHRLRRRARREPEGALSLKRASPPPIKDLRTVQIRYAASGRLKEVKHWLLWKTWALSSIRSTAALTVARIRPKWRACAPVTTRARS